MVEAIVQDWQIKWRSGIHEHAVSTVRYRGWQHVERSIGTCVVYNALTEQAASGQHVG